MENDKGKTTLVLTHDHIYNYATGLYHGREGPVAVLTMYCTGPVWSEQPNGKGRKGWDLATLDKTLRTTLTPPVSLEDVGKAYIHMGAAARALAEQLHSAGKDLTLVAYPCGAKMATIKERGIPIIWADECSGYYTLGEILDYLLGRSERWNIKGL